MCTRAGKPDISQNCITITNFERFWNPDFLSFDVMKEWIETLKEKKRRNCQLKVTSVFKPIADIACVWCQKLKLTQNVFHRTLELFDQFLLRYMSSLTQTPQSISSKSDGYTTPGKNIKEVDAELKHKGILYLVSCLQIASKLEDGYKVVSVKQAEFLLAEVASPFNSSSIVHSEIQVLSTLNFDVDILPISEYVNFLICELVYYIKRDSSSSSRDVLCAIDDIHEASLLVVRSLYLGTTETKEKIMGEGICTVLHGPGNLTGQDSQSEDHKMVLACAAIAASTFRTQPSWAVHVMKHLYTICGIHPDIIAHISTVLHDYIEEGIENVVCTKQLNTLNEF